MTCERQQGFDICCIRKIKDIFDTTWLSFNVYLGHDPAYLYPDYGFRENQQQTAAGSFGGKQQDWLFFKNDAHAVLLKEQRFPVGPPAERWMIHIVLTADRMSLIKELEHIAATIKFADQ